jgi:hypothetical protein
MKVRAIIAAVLMTVFSTAAFSQIIPARVNVVVLSEQVTLQVFNPFPRPIVCNAQVFGRTYMGAVYNAFFNQQLIYPGTDRVALVSAFPGNPFVHGYGNTYCQFAF